MAKYDKKIALQIIVNAAKEYEIKLNNKHSTFSSPINKYQFFITVAGSEGIHGIAGKSGSRVGQAHWKEIFYHLP